MEEVILSSSGMIDRSDSTVNTLIFDSDKVWNIFSGNNSCPPKCCLFLVSIIIHSFLVTGPTCSSLFWPRQEHLVVLALSVSGCIGQFVLSDKLNTVIRGRQQCQCLHREFPFYADCFEIFGKDRTTLLF